MTDLTDVKGIGPARAESLGLIGIETVKDLANADPKLLSNSDELNRLNDDTALELIVAAENAIEEEEEPEVEEEEEPEVEEEEEPEVEEEEEPEVEEEEEPEVEEEEEITQEEMIAEGDKREYDVSFDLNYRQKQIFISGLLEFYVDQRNNNRSRALACDEVLDKIEDSHDITVTEEQLNAIYSAVRKKATEYKGNNHVALMNEARAIVDQITEYRKEYLF